MKKIDPEMNDWIRPEYKRSDLGKLIRGKYALTQIQFEELVKLLLTCIGEDEGIQFIHHSSGNVLAAHTLGDWTYELDNSNQITLRYWLGEFSSIDEPLSNPTAIASPQERTELSSLLLEHVRSLRTRVSKLNK